MKPVNLMGLILRAELALRRQHPWSLAVLLLCLLALVGWLWLVPVWQARLGRLRTEAMQIDAMLLRPLPAAPAGEAPRAQQNLDAFMASLGDARHTEQQVRTLFVIGRDLAMELPQGQYRLNCDESSAVCNYRVQLPVTGSYSQVRRFVEQSLQAIPFAALDEMSFKRESVAEGEIEGRLGLTLYVKARAGVTGDGWGAGR